MRKKISKISRLLTKLTTQAVLAIKQVKTHSKITLSNMYVNIKQYNFSRYEVFAKIYLVIM